MIKKESSKDILTLSVDAFENLTSSLVVWNLKPISEQTFEPTFDHFDVENLVAFMFSNMEQRIFDTLPKRTKDVFIITFLKKIVPLVTPETDPKVLEDAIHITNLVVASGELNNFVKSRIYQLPWNSLRGRGFDEAITCIQERTRVQPVTFIDTTDLQNRSRQHNESFGRTNSNNPKIDRDKID